MDKKNARLRRAKRLRINTRKFNKVRLCIFRTAQHIYAQVIAGDGTQVLTSASTLEKSIRINSQYGGNVSAAKIVGEAIAKRALSLDIIKVVFDRSGFKYHGRIKALADAARQHGLSF